MLPGSSARKFTSALHWHHKAAVALYVLDKATAAAADSSVLVMSVCTLSLPLAPVGFDLTLG